MSACICNHKYKWHRYDCPMFDPADYGLNIPKRDCCDSRVNEYHRDDCPKRLAELLDNSRRAVQPMVEREAEGERWPMTTPVSEQKVSPEIRKLVEHFGSFKHNTHPMSEAQRTRRAASREALFNAISSLESQLAEARRDTERLRDAIDVALHTMREPMGLEDARRARRDLTHVYVELKKNEARADSARGAPHD